MIFKGEKIISQIFNTGARIKAIYKTNESGTPKLVWLATFISLVRSCFGSGRWLNNKPWVVNDTWKNI